MERRLTYRITKDYDRCTIKDFLKHQGYSGKNIIELKKTRESILLNGVWEYVAKRMAAGDMLEIRIMENEKNDRIIPVCLPFPIVYEDEDLLIVNKPANMPTHPSLHNYDNSLANAAAYHFGMRGIPYTFRCINRLDKDTTGLTILAKHMVSASLLSSLIKERKITREYRAIVSGTLDNDYGTIDAPIGRCSDSLITRMVDYADGERAVTHYKKLATCNNRTYVSLHLETGRTHQIRVHMAHIGHPLIGDYLYNPDYRQKPLPSCTAYMNRQALHAYRLAFLHPITKKNMEFTAPLPDDMQALLCR